MRTCERESIYDSEDDFWESLLRAEQAEAGLSYLSACQSERARKLAGSYFTPADGACFFWDQFFFVAGIVDADSAIRLLREYSFVEPAAGAGALVFALLHKLQALGVGKRELADIDLTVIDINPSALNFIRTEFSERMAEYPYGFSNVRFHCEDFLAIRPPGEKKNVLVFGNPPFVRNSPTTSAWKNLFADFVDRSLEWCGTKGAMQFVVPLSISFSRDYRALRSKLLSGKRAVALSHFDNMPDTFFRSGKPKSTNTNKANSQRCTIVTVSPASRNKVLSTSLQTWRAGERARFFKKLPHFHDVTDLSNEKAIPRPVDKCFLDYLRAGSFWMRFDDLMDRRGKYALYIGGVARNYIGVREASGAGVSELRFPTKRAWRVALLVLTSDLFLAYWRSLGDGFHVTKTNICEFPLEQRLYNELVRRERKADEMWKNRASYIKTKKNNGVDAVSYDMRASSLSLLPRIGSAGSPF